ncbi:MAG: ATP-binding cassette domain-containing protein, partial [Rhodospirillaceae bacterium]|nr:ATP-binding cassette domain-containing protein [Rhodospirillaceae bacterium]
FVAWRSAGAMAEASGRERKSTQSRDSLIGEMIAGRTTIKALALHRTMEPVWEEKHANNIETSVMRGAKTDSFSNLGATLSMITSILLTTVGALAIIDQRLTVGALIATNMLSGRILGPLNQLVGTWRTYSGFIQSVERLGGIFESEGEREVSEVKLEKPKGNISCEGIIFSYSANSAPVVSGITVEIPKGGVHALVGRNGSGKTTLLKIIQGLYRPQKGRVMLDGADIAQFSRDELSEWLGYVPQESVLFAGTVRDNISSRKPNATDDEIIKAATEAGVHHFIIDLPDGYATEIGEAGSRLSGGQRQRIAIARALVGDPPVVLMDEPSSSLDRHAEFELKKTLKDISETRTVIMVTHSPTLLSVCDFLYALDKGKLALAGPANEILPRLFGGKIPDAGPEPKQDAPPPKEAATKGLGKGSAQGMAKAKPTQGKPIGKIEPKRIAVPINNEIAAKKSPLAQEIAEKAAMLAKRNAPSAAMPAKRSAPEITPPTPAASKPMPKIVIGAKKRPNTAQILKAWNEGKPLPISRKNANGSRTRSTTVSRSTPRLRGGSNKTGRPGAPVGE